MIRKLLLALAALAMSASCAFAQVDVNTADAATLGTVKGIGPAKSKAIVAERRRGGPFRDWANFESRIKDADGKNATLWSDAGLLIHGQTREGAAFRPASTVKAVQSEVKEDAKEDANADAKAERATVPAGAVVPDKAELPSSSAKTPVPATPVVR